MSWTPVQTNLNKANDGPFLSPSLGHPYMWLDEQQASMLGFTDPKSDYWDSTHVLASVRWLDAMRLETPVNNRLLQIESKPIESIRRELRYLLNLRKQRESKSMEFLLENGANFRYLTAVLLNGKRCEVETATDEAIGLLFLNSNRCALLMKEARGFYIEPELDGKGWSIFHVSRKSLESRRVWIREARHWVEEVDEDDEGDD